ncbi:restriction endonuclease subunit S [Klebsiella quasipneumoniae]|uniref:restriction endonuclease subunit S n=1 Tax=Klebsiella quasipneumoniae TaxID=1463165 RepID=UPI002DBFB21F|nr:restriction endonuclease subunit S [Klebsiella quasipneumoniae]MEB6587247.1 restriction endonuclease subunit S [Klebsiella quasipneumoniae]HBR1291830.1 restriction endonuclease subunit S [Klebsiella quasipneumoniae subsp. similipneumoniae]
MAGLNKYRAYLEYNFTNIEGLVQLPSHWELKQVRYLLKDGAEGTKIGPFGSSLKLEDMVDDGVQVYGQENVIKRDFSLGKRRISFNKFKEMGVYEVFSGDILITMMGTSGKCEIVPQTAEKGIIDSHLIRVRVNNKLIIPEFFKLLVDECPEIKHQIKIQGKGSIMLGLNSGVIRSLYLPLPKVSEQQIILSFLDYETAKIDNLIEKQQQLIELLKEKRQAVISHAVTKGLSPDVPMKDSGVEWLGEVPEHWGITKLKWVGRTTSGGTPTTSKFEIYYEDGHIPWIRTTDLNNGELFDTPIRITSKAVNDTACSILPVGSVLLGMYGGAGSIGKHAILRFESTINQAVCGVLPCGRVLPDFLHKYYEFYRPFWMVDAAGTRKDPNIGQDNIKEGIVLIPPFEEQIEINNHIDNMRNIYECIIENALEGMDLLQERRTALISAAVTGKIDVRDWVAPDTQDVEEPQEATA